MKFDVTPTQLFAAFAVVLVLVWMGQASVRRARAAADAARSGALLAA